MREIEKIRDEIRKRMPELRDKYGVKTLGIFGSYVRGEQRKRSDVDILVEFKEPVSLLEFVALERELSETADKKVDLVMKTALKPRIAKHVLSKVVYI